jgi:hypothetical protein
LFILNFQIILLIFSWPNPTISHRFPQKKPTKFPINK